MKIKSNTTNNDEDEDEDDRWQSGNRKVSKKVDALSCYHMWKAHQKGVSCDEETSGACHNETSQDFEKATGAPEGQTREGRNHGLCVQNSVQQLWEDLHRWDWKKARDKTKRT